MTGSFGGLGDGCTSSYRPERLFFRGFELGHDSKTKPQNRRLWSFFPFTKQAFLVPFSDQQLFVATFAVLHRWSGGCFFLFSSLRLLRLAWENLWLKDDTEINSYPNASECLKTLQLKALTAWRDMDCSFVCLRNSKQITMRNGPQQTHSSKDFSKRHKRWLLVPGSLVNTHFKPSEIDDCRTVGLGLQFTIFPKRYVKSLLTALKSLRIMKLRTLLGFAGWVWGNLVR